MSKEKNLYLLKSEKEIKEALKACVRERRQNGPLPKNCPFGIKCCPECTTPHTLKWVLKKESEK